ncbi:hypothetical protein Zm00014a_038500 [Zea mays]|uniref:Uncharacterized protein n=1 Tax=Zea mays TaxID=4577 RepID=A0A3L6FEB5_MAIZE|nr:hypothetical protein Zm00014a_038500 [Zea mays]
MVFKLDLVTGELICTLVG